jgi:hypothetical protein
MHLFFWFERIFFFSFLFPVILKRVGYWSAWKCRKMLHYVSCNYSLRMLEHSLSLSLSTTVHEGFLLDDAYDMPSPWAAAEFYVNVLSRLTFLTLPH